MKISREELLRQRELVAGHLKWIDRQLEVIKGRNPREEASEAPSPEKSSAGAARASKTAEDFSALREMEEVEVSSILENYGGNTTTSVAQVKFGCILLAVLLGALGLFFFLGLPYLLAE